MTPGELELVARIERAFAGVTLGDGIGMYEAYALDGGGINQREWRKRDEREDWRLLLMNRDFIEWQGRAQYSFMDAKGILFALPAEMIRSLRYDEDFPAWILADLTDPTRTPEHRPWIAALKSEQCACVARFVRIQLENEREWEANGCISDWRRPYDSYWHAFDSEENGPSTA